MSFHRPLIASIIVCGTLATGTAFAQATPSNPAPVQNTVPTAPPTQGMPQQQLQEQQMQQQQLQQQQMQQQRQQELQRQQQNLHQGVQTNSDRVTHPESGTTGNPASPSSIH